jgi:hypothetical protein
MPSSMRRSRLLRCVGRTRQRSIGAAFFTMSCKCRAELRRHFIILGLTEGRRKGLSGSLVPAPWLQVCKPSHVQIAPDFFCGGRTRQALGWARGHTVYCVQKRARWRTSC